MDTIMKQWEVVSTVPPSQSSEQSVLINYADQCDCRYEPFGRNGCIGKDAC
jgi:hypothetical protein